MVLRKNIASMLEKMPLTAKRQAKQDGIGSDKRRNVIHRVGGSRQQARRDYSPKPPRGPGGLATRQLQLTDA